MPTPDNDPAWSNSDRSGDQPDHSSRGPSQFPEGLRIPNNLSPENEARLRFGLNASRYSEIVLDPIGVGFMHNEYHRLANFLLLGPQFDTHPCKSECDPLRSARISHPWKTPCLD